MQEEMSYKKRCVALLFPENLKNCFTGVIENYRWISELRIRRNGPVQVLMKGTYFYINIKGEFHKDVRESISLVGDEFDELFRHICRHSVYAFEEELKNGYLTVEGGHRIGVVGQTVWDGEKIKSIKNLNALNLRIAHEIKGAADAVLPYLFAEEGLLSTLLVSLPGCGKTTLLRDLIRKISNGSRCYLPMNVSLIDERSEIASCYLGIAQNDVGRHTDIMDACPKAVGMMMVLRSMSPQVIAVDELGGREDYDVLRRAFYLGCRIVATVHGDNLESLQKNPLLSPLLGEGGFKRIVFLNGTKGPGTIAGIYDENGEEIYPC